MTHHADLAASRALWNRDRLRLDSDEILAQLLDRGELWAWRELYSLASRPGPEAADLRRRIVRLCCSGSIAFPHLFLAAMAHLGESLDAYPEIPASDDRIA